MEKKEVTLMIVEKILQSELFMDIYNTESFVSHLLIQRFEDFLLDSSFDITIRQLYLLKFLKNNYPIELSRHVIETINNSIFKKDYEKVILEWNYFAADFIKQSALAPFDCAGFSMTKQNIEETKKLNRYKNDFLSQITMLLIEDSDNKE